jgi:hypothetical protein
MVHPMGESINEVMRLEIASRLKLVFQRSKVASDGGLLACRALDDALGPTEVAGSFFQDGCTGKYGRHEMVGQFRQSVFGPLVGTTTSSMC